MSKLLAALLATLALAPASSHANWIEARSRHFVLLAEDAPERVRELAANLERFDQAARHVFELPDAESPGSRITLYVVDRRTVESIVGVGTAGAYRGRASGSVAVARRSFAGSNRALFHEYAHHLLQSHYSSSWPFWLAEGSAEFLATAAIQVDGSVAIGLPLDERKLELDQLQYVQLTPLLQMSDATLRAQPALSYTRGWLLVHYLAFAPARQGQLDSYLQSLERGVDRTAAARVAFGNPVELDRNLKAYAKEPLQHTTVPRDAINVGAITLREVSAGERAVIPYQMRLRVGVEASQTADLLRSMQAAAQPFPDDAMAQLALAEAELDAGNHEAAGLAADRALTADPKLAAAHLYKGRARMAATWYAGSNDAQRWTQIQEAFLAASELDPHDPEPLVLTYLTCLITGRTPTANIVAGLYRAHESVPQDDNVRVLAAYQSLIEGKDEQARRLLAFTVADSSIEATRSRMATVLARLDKEGAAAALRAFSKDDLADVIASF